jgi:hypothetical protein
MRLLIGAESSGELVTAFETMKKEKINGLLVQADALFIQEGARIVALAADYKMPAIYRLRSCRSARPLVRPICASRDSLRAYPGRHKAGQGLQDLYRSAVTS